MKFKLENFKKVAYPCEYGAWGFFLEPIVLALLISYTTDGLLIGISAFLLFLAYQPSTYIIKQTPKTLLAISYVVLSVYLLITTLILYCVIYSSSNYFFFWPFLLAIFLMVIFKISEAANINRKLFFELIPQVAVALMASSILLKNNWELEFVVGFVIIVFSRSIQTVFYINNKLKFVKGFKPNKTIVDLIGISFLLILIFLYDKEIVPLLSIFAVVGLMFRVYLGFQNSLQNEKVKIIGIKEFIYGFLFVIVNSIGYLIRL